MTVSLEQMILYSAREDNILPLTSTCNVRCIFCSHPQNPSGVQVYGIGHRTLDDVARMLEFIDAERKIVIGESVTRIMEGEPFLHPQIKTILRMIRQKFPTTLIQITTNGTLLTDDVLELLEECGSIELYISLNSVTERGRERLMGDTAGQVLRAIPELQRRGIAFHGSIVAMPWVVGYEDIAQTIAFLERYGAETVRIFLPGYTAKAAEALRFGPELWTDLVNWVKDVQIHTRVPLSVEPSQVRDLRAVVEGVIANSPATCAGFLPGDEVLRVGAAVPFSRVDAFRKLTAASKTEVVVQRSSASLKAENDRVQHHAEKLAQEDTLDLQGEKLTLKLEKERDSRSGLVFSYDFDPDVFTDIRAAIVRGKAQRPLIMTSTLATPVMAVVVDRLREELDGVSPEMATVENRFFGGSIMAGGLLVVQDFLDQWNALTDHRYDLVLVPGIFLDPWGTDLTGHSYEELEEVLGVPVEIIEI